MSAYKYVCTACHRDHSSWAGRCGHCGAWNTIAEHPTATTGSQRPDAPQTPAHTVDELKNHTIRYTETGLPEFDRILGGGLVDAQVVLIAGPPGVGKSTLTLTLAQHISTDGPILVISGEESAHQVASRAHRIGARSSRIRIVSTNSLPEAVAHMHALHPTLLVLDSIQAIGSPDTSSKLGSPNQVIEVARVITEYCKQSNTPAIIIGQSTKDSSIAGPQELAHIVDTVLEFSGDPTSRLRVLHVLKNRYGPDGETAYFEQVSTGLRGITDPSGLFTQHRDHPVPGTCLTATMDGRRAIMAEIQALVTAPISSYPRRNITGLDPTRAAILTAVTAQHHAVELHSRDVYTSTISGIRITEPGVDLAICLALSSAFAQRPLPQLCAIAEVTLSGDLRNPPQVQARLTEAARHGITHAIVARRPDNCPDTLTIIQAEHLSQAIAAAALLAPRTELEPPRSVKMMAT